MRNSAIATSVRLPEEMETVLNEVVKKLHTTKTSFIRRAILERIEDELDISLAEEILSRNEKTYSLEEVERELGLAN